MRSEEYAKGYILEKDGEPAGTDNQLYLFTRGWRKGRVVRGAVYPTTVPLPGAGKEFFTYVDEKIAPTVKRIRLEIEPDNLRAKKLYLAMGYEDLAYAQMVKEVQEGK